MPTPIMTPREERLMALEGLIQWTAAAIGQADRLDDSTIETMPEARRRLTAAARRSEADFFVNATWKLLQFRKWVNALGLCATIDFSEIDKFDTNDIRDLRNMREHVVDYFRGCGDNPDRWWIETPEYKSDASAMIGNMIGGRLNYKAFSEAAKRLLPHLLKEPLPSA
jgi:hypothetical protein